MIAVVTGATGFLGQTLVRQLVRQRVEVRALHRRAGDAASLRTLGATPVLGDLGSAAACTALATPGATVFHAVARVDVLGTATDFKRDTVDVTAHLLDAVLPQRPARFVYVSSAAVYSAQDSPHGVCAARTPAQPDHFNRYGRAKLAAEELVRARCGAAGCPWTILRLPFLYGPGNRLVVEKFALAAQRRKLAFVGRPDNPLATVYVGDAAEALWLCSTAPTAVNQVYDVASMEVVTQAQYVNEHLAVLGLPPVTRTVPRGLAYATAAVAEGLCWLTGATPAVTRGLVMLMSTPQHVDAGRVQHAVGWRARTTFAEGMRHMAAWHQAQAAGPIPSSPPVAPRRRQPA